MVKLFVVALSGMLASPAVAQVAPQLAPQPQLQAATPAPAPAAPKMIKKVVCERVVIEETTGSRLGSAPKKCRTIEVPAPAVKPGAPAQPSERG